MGNLSYMSIFKEVGKNSHFKLTASDAFLSHIDRKSSSSPLREDPPLHHASLFLLREDPTSPSLWHEASLSLCSLCTLPPLSRQGSFLPPWLVSLSLSPPRPLSPHNSPMPSISMSTLSSCGPPPPLPCHITKVIHFLPNFCLCGSY